MRSDLRALFDRCEDQRRRILDGLAGLSPAQQEYRPGEDAWSLLEELHHLVLTDQETVRMASDPAALAGLVQTFGQERRGVPFYLAWAILRCGIRVPVPTDSVLPARGQALAGLDARWERARGRLCSLLETVQDPRRPFAVHPVCGPLTPAQVLRFIEVHVGYHERNMARLRRVRGFPLN